MYKGNSRQVQEDRRGEALIDSDPEESSQDVANLLRGCNNGSNFLRHSGDGICNSNKYGFQIPYSAWRILNNILPEYADTHPLVAIYLAS